MHNHLVHTYHLDVFYFDLLEKMSKQFHTQNAKRVVLEAYLSMLEFEGHFTYPLVCTSCHQVIEHKVVFAKGLKAFHTHCLHQNMVFNIDELERFFALKNSFFISDKLVDSLFEIII